MSDDVDLAKAAVGGAVGGFSIGKVVDFIVARFIKKSDKNEDKLEAQGEQRLVHCEKALEAHRELIANLVTKNVELDTRLGFREGRFGSEPLTNPGARPTPQLDAFRAEMAKRAKEGTGE